MSGTENTEIERKFRVAAVPPLDGLRGEAVRQGYVTGASDMVEVRLRQIGRRYFITVKSEGVIARSEHETAITEEQFAALWPATGDRRLEKTRYCGTLPGGLTFDLDVFAGRLAPLVLVEVEFPTLEAAHAFTPPDWLGEDVSADKRYKNKTMACVGPTGTDNEKTAPT